MAKARKRAPAGHTRKRSAKKAAKAASKKRTIKTLKQPPLGGMEQVRHVKLDGLCESIGDTRAKKNELQENEDSDIQAALDYMVKQSPRVESYHHAGLELVLRPGAFKLSVRKHKEMTAQMSDDGPETAGDENDRGDDE